MAHLGIAGAGLLGRLLAWTLAHRGHRVQVFDPADGPAPRFDGHGAAAFTAAGLLSPLAERDAAGERLAALGWRSLPLWRAVQQALPSKPMLRLDDSLLLAHPSDLGSAQRLLAKLPAGQAEAVRPSTLEPSLDPRLHGWRLPGEGQVDTVAMLQALHDDASGVQWHWQRTVQSLQPGVLEVDGERHRFDTVFDVRGLGARPDLPLRGVRGETVWLHARGHGLTRPVRLLHPRHRVYLAPRPGDLLVVGASEIESEDRSEVSLKTAVELMAAAHSALPALAEARIVRLDRNLRPALPDNEPQVDVAPGRVRINGLFRHGWLLAPALAEKALSLGCHA